MHGRVSYKNAKLWIWSAAIAAAVLALCSKSSPLYRLNDWMDANIFYTMGKAMMNGLVLYRDAFDHKGPVLYLVYGLGYLLDETGFVGVFMLEIAALTVSLVFGLKTVAVLRGRAVAPAWCALPALAVAVGRAFSHGGSAEEFCLPLLAVALWALVSALTASEPLPLRQALLQGVLAATALWLKYTVLGFYLVWALVLAVVYLRRRREKALARSIGVYLLGMALATLPWLLYFGVNGALADWGTAYFYDNLALYGGSERGPFVLHLARCLRWALRDNPLAAICLAAGVVGLWLRRRRAAAAAVAALALGLAVTSFTGSYLVYYGLCLAVFAPLPLVLLPERWPLPTWGCRVAPALAGLVLPLCLWLSPNAPLLGRAADEMPQFRFAAQLEPGTSLLNYGTLDGGFYTVTGALPPCRYFCVTNMPLPDQWTQQRELLASVAVDAVVSLDGGLAEQYPAYRLADEYSYNGGEGEITWYLYQKV